MNRFQIRPGAGMESSEISRRLNRIAALDLTSDDSIKIIQTILPHSQQLKGQNAQKFIDILDKIMPAIRTKADLFQKCLLALRKICGTQGIVPASHVLSHGLVKNNERPSAGGGSADVWRGKYGSEEVAIKVLRTYATADFVKVRKSIYKEVVIWKQLKHPNIVPFLGVSYTFLPLCTVSKWMPHGTMLEYLGARPYTNRPLLLLDVCKGLHYLHSLDFAHGDLKSLNILINDELQACLADFGLTSVKSPLNTVNASTIVSNPRGTYLWMAPELLQPDYDPSHDIRPSPESDMYALAMVVIELFSGKFPFHEVRPSSAVILKVINGERPSRPEGSLELGLTDDIWELVQKCWQHDRENRPQISFVLNRLRACAPRIPRHERLSDFDPNSQESIDIVRSILDGPLDVVFATDVTDDDQIKFIEMLDQVMGSPNPYVDDEMRRKCTSMLGILYSRTGFLPSSYRISGRLEKSHDEPIILGTYADMWKGACNGRAVALKTSRSSRSDKRETVRERVFEQVSTWVRLSHPNIVPFLGISNEFPPCIISKWMGRGTVTEYLLSNPGADRVRLLIDICTGLQFLHSRKIVHRDLKAAHVLVNGAGKACLIGFRLAVQVGDKTPLESLNFATAPHGSYRWMAPELIDLKDVESMNSCVFEAGDIYAFAMVALEMFTGRVPFCDVPSDSAVILRVMQGVRPERPKQALELGLTESIWQLMELCWHGQFEHRPGISSVLRYLRQPDPGISGPKRLVLELSDPPPAACIDILRSILDSPTEMTSLLTCDDPDTPKYIDMLDKAIGSPQSDPVLDRKSLQALSKLWHRTRLLPPSYPLLSGFKDSEQVTQTHCFANTFRATYNNTVVAIKEYKSSDPDAVKMFLHEAVIWKRLSHPNILPFVGISNEPYPLCIISPWMVYGNVRQYLRSHPEASRVQLVIDIANGLQYLHSRKIVHGNLKGTNVLVNDEGRALLFGFDLSIIHDPYAQINDVSDYVNGGQISSMAPELLIPENASYDTRRRSTASDVYAFAIMVVAEIYRGGDLPLTATPLAISHTISGIANGKRPTRMNDDLEIGLSDDIWELFEMCWDQRPDMRPTSMFVLDQLKRIRARRGSVTSSASDHNSSLGFNNRGSVDNHSKMSSESARKRHRRSASFFFWPR